MKIHELIRTLKELATGQDDGKVFLVEDGRQGQWPATVVRLATAGENRRAGNKTGIGMAVITTGEEKELTLQLLAEKLRCGWPENGSVCAGVTFDRDGGVRVGDISAVKWSYLKHLGEFPAEERVVAIVIRYFASEGASKVDHPGC
jgi:hypothetical protein